MKKNIYIFSALIIVGFLVSLLIPTLFWVKDYFNGVNNRIDSKILSEYAIFQTLIIGFWSLILNAFLVIIAFKAFKNFDVKKQFHNKQLDIVSELATSLSSTELSNMMYDMKSDPTGKKHQIATGFKFSFFEIALGFNYSKFELLCVRGNNIENIFPFLKYKNHPLLPRSISEKLKKLYTPLHYSGTIKSEKLETKNYVLLYGVKKVDTNDISRTGIYEYYKNPSEFVEDVMLLRKSIIDWYKEYGADNLNI